jgi:protein arginine kinase activator
MMSDCKFCGRQADMYFRSNIGKNNGDILICSNCLSKNSPFELPLAVIGDEIITKINKASIEEQKKSRETLLKSCGKCGKSLLDISRSGYFGCDECYDTYRELIAGAKKICNKDKTVKKYKDTKKDFSPSIKQGKIKILEEKLQNAVREENFEKAAEIRDIINTMKKKV